MTTKFFITFLLGLSLLTAGCGYQVKKSQPGFSATMEATVSGITSQATIVARDNKYRLEIIGGRRSSTMIADYDLGTLWLMVPAEKKYKKMSVDEVKEDLPEFFRKETEIEKTFIGEETVDSIKAKKYKVKVKSVRNKEFEGNLWESTQLPGYPLKWEDLNSGLVVVWKDAKITDMPDSTFELPADYTEL